MQRWSLRTRFLLFALACLIPFAAVVAYSFDRDRDRSIDRLVAHEISMASAVSRGVSSYLATNADALEGIAQLESVISLNPEQSGDSLGQARNVRPELSGIFLINTENEIVSSSGTDPELLLPYVTPQLEQTVSHNAVTISQRIPLDNESSVIVLMVPVTTVQTTATTAAPGDTEAAEDAPESDIVTTQPTPTPTPDSEQAVQPPGQTTGVIGGVMQVERLAQATLPSSRGLSEIAVASNGEILFSTGGIDRETSTLLSDHEDELLLALDGDATPFNSTDALGDERVAVAVPVGYDAAPWVTVVAQPFPGLLDGISRTEAIIVFTLAFIVILALAFVLGEITARPLRRLSQQARDLHRGTLKEPIVPIGSGEVRTLSEHFSEMANQIESQVAGLEENQHERERQAAQMRDLLRRTNRMQEDERRRIAGEIHDAVAPLITGALYQARALQMTNGSTREEELDSSLRSVNELLERAGNELHDVIFELRPPDLDDLGIVAAIEAYVQTIQRTGLSCRLEVTGEPASLTPEVRLSMYRIVQEALHNVVRHAGADEAVVHMETTDEFVRITIRDNGAGFDPAEAVQPRSLGLLSMRERAESIAATLTIVSKPGGGTAIVIERANSGDVMSDEVLESMMSMSNGTSLVELDHADHDPDLTAEVQPAEHTR